MTPSRVGIVGTGPVARALGACLADAGHDVAALAGRDPQRTAAAAAHIGSTVQAVSVDEIAHLVDRVILAVRDDAIGDMARSLAPVLTGIALHTSGASGLAPCEPLRAAGVACGVLHPLQSVVPVARGENPFEGAAFGVVGDAPAVEWAAVVVASVNGHVLALEEESLASYHAGAVMASNALVAVIDGAVTLLAQAGLDREAARRAIGPLSRASVENVLRLGPEAALTGPVVRGDVSTVAAHLQAVGRAPQTVSDLYRASARHLLSLARRRGLTGSTARALTQMIEERNQDREGRHVQETRADD